MTYKVFTSPTTTIGTELEMEVSPSFSHCFAGIRFYDVNDKQVQPTAGTVVIMAKHLTNNNYDFVVDSTLDATNPGSEAQWGGNVTTVKATPSGIVGAVTYKLVVVQNQS